MGRRSAVTDKNGENLSGGAVASERYRPVLRGDLSQWCGEPLAGAYHQCAGDDAAAARADALARTVLECGRASRQQAERLVGLAEEVGLAPLAQVWGSAEPDTLPGALWALYLLRTWCHRQGAEVADLYRTGRADAEVADVIAGVAELPGAGDVRTAADAILRAAFGADFSLALTRAAAFHRVVAAGRRVLAAAGAEPGRQRRLAGGNQHCAEQLERAAGRTWDR
jgi:hypothetical protein